MWQTCPKGVQTETWQCKKLCTLAVLWEARCSWKRKFQNSIGFHHAVWSMIEAKRPDIVIADKVKKETMIKDVAIPGDKRVCDK